MTTRKLLLPLAAAAIATAGVTVATAGGATATPRDQLPTLSSQGVQLQNLPIHAAAGSALPPTARALAVVAASGVTSKVKGFTQIQRAANGITCLALPGNIKPGSAVPVVSADLSNTNNFPAVAEVFTGPSSAAGCPGGNVVVITADSTGSFVNESFTIAVP